MTRSRVFFLSTASAVLCAGLVLALALVSSLPFGWGALLVAILGGVALVGLSARGVGVPRRGWILPFFLLLAWIALQAFNPTHRQVENFGTELRPLAHLAWLPGSVSRPDTLQALALAAVAGLLLALARETFAPNRFVTRVLVVVLVTGASCMALLTILQRLTPKPFPVYELTGAFVNENQYAAFMNMFIPLTLWLALDYRRRAVSEGRLSHPGILFIALLGAQVSSILLSGSRAGIAIALLSLTSVAVLEWRRWRHHANRLGNASVLPLLAAMLVCLGVGGSLAAPTLRREFATIQRLDSELVFRGRICASTWNLFRSNWVSGCGAGTFSIAYRYFQPEEVKGFVRHAHCDPLQSLAELGAPGFAAAAATLVLVLRRPGSRRSGPSQPAGLRFRSAAGLALGGLALHACLDFPFREPSILMSACLLLGLASAGAPVPESGANRGEDDA